MNIQLNADRTRRALVHGAQLPWVNSPEPGVQRRMLERSGGEVAVASTIVRYAPGSRFPQHTHGRGEEFVVLDGTFSDEHGDYPAGTYVRNPPDSVHAPFSRGGCVIFVKLRQMQADEVETVRILPHERTWREIGGGHTQALLYKNRHIRVALDRLEPNSVVETNYLDKGVEIFVLDGSAVFSDYLPEQSVALGHWSWLRTPHSLSQLRAGERGALLWVKHQHF